MSSSILEIVYQPTTVAIIGSAGRKRDENVMSLKLYEKMVIKAKDIIENEFKLNLKDVVLVSGGASFSDHVAVSLFLQYEIKGLKLYLPCNFEKGKFFDNESKDWRVNSGKLSNYYHENFSEKVGFNSLEQLEKIKNMENVVFDMLQKGFHSRNTMIAKSDYLIAFSRGEKEPEDGGTLDTWRKCKINKENKVHVCFDIFE